MYLLNVCVCLNLYMCVYIYTHTLSFIISAIHSSVHFFHNSFLHLSALIHPFISSFMSFFSLLFSSSVTHHWFVLIGVWILESHYSEILNRWNNVMIKWSETSVGEFSVFEGRSTMSGINSQRLRTKTSALRERAPEPAQRPLLFTRNTSARKYSTITSVHSQY